LALKVCDPACGSGSFLLAALRFLTNALVESLHHHQRLVPNPTGVIVRLADDKQQPVWLTKPSQNPSAIPISTTTCGIPPTAHCGALPLWGRSRSACRGTRPSFPLDRNHGSPPALRIPGSQDEDWQCTHRLLVDRFQDYPAMAWDRDGGDKDRKKFVHHYRKQGESQKGDKWTHAIKERKETVRGELVQVIRARREEAFEFFEKELSPIASTIIWSVSRGDPQRVDPGCRERRRIYERHFGPGTAYRQLRAAFDTWCAIWFLARRSA